MLHLCLDSLHIHNIELNIQKIKDEIIKFVTDLPLKENPLEDIMYKETNIKLEKNILLNI